MITDSRSVRIAVAAEETTTVCCSRIRACDAERGVSFLSSFIAAAGADLRGL